MTIRGRLLSVFAAAFLVSTGLTTLLAHRLLSDALEATAVGRLQRLAGEFAALGDQAVLEATNALNVFARRRDLGPQVLVDDADLVIATALRDLASTGFYSDPLDCVDWDGRIVASSNPRRVGSSSTDEAWYKACRAGGLVDGELELDRLGRPALRVARRIGSPLLAADSSPRAGPFTTSPTSRGPMAASAGFVSVLVDLESIGRLVDRLQDQERSAGFSSTTLRMVDPRATIMVARDRTEVMKVGLEQTLGLSAEGWRTLGPRSAITRAPDGVDHLVVALRRSQPGPLSSRGWTAVAAQSSVEALGPSRTLLVWVVLLSLMVALCGGGLGAAALGRLVSPIHRYAVFADRVGHGDLEGRLSVEGVADLAHLGASLERMRENLVARAREVVERTTDLERKNLELERAHAETAAHALALEQASRYKSEFLANMSHELRTPLNSMLILAHLMSQNKQGALSIKQLGMIQTIHSAGQDLLRIINDLLDLAKIEAGKMSLQAQPFTVETLVTAIRRSFDPVAEHRKVALVIEVEPQVPHVLETDQFRLEQILRNLLANAFKFTHAGRVTLRIGTVDEDKAGAQDLVRFEVADTGIGIPPEKLDLIFAAFQQADGTTTRRFGGTGLGLSISRHLASLLGGSVSVMSAEGKGSTFSLVVGRCLPSASDGGRSGRHRHLPPVQGHPSNSGEPPSIKLAEGSGGPDSTPRSGRGTPAGPDELGSPDEAVAASVRGAATGPLVLLVDDDERNRMSAGQLLESLGLRVLTADRGEEALKLLDANADVALVLMDLMMPVMDGLECTRRIHAIERFRDLPIVALSARVAMEDRDLSLAAGAVDHLGKPVDVLALRSLLESHLGPLGM